MPINIHEATIDKIPGHQFYKARDLETYLISIHTIIL